MPKSALPTKTTRRGKYTTQGLNNRKTGFADYTKYDDSGGKYGYHSNAQKKAWNGAYSSSSRVSNRADDVRFESEYPKAKEVSAYQQHLKRERKKSSRTTAMANGRRIK